MIDEDPIPCDYNQCDVYIVRPGKLQCSFEDTRFCSATNGYKIQPVRWRFFKHATKKSK